MAASHKKANNMKGVDDGGWPPLKLAFVAGVLMGSNVSLLMLSLGEGAHLRRSPIPAHH